MINVEETNLLVDASSLFKDANWTASQVQEKVKRYIRYYLRRASGQPIWPRETNRYPLKVVPFSLPVPQVTGLQF